jgi:hypothetical protein
MWHILRYVGVQFGTKVSEEHTLFIFEVEYGSGIETGYGLDVRGSSSSRGRDFSFLHNFQICSGVHPAAYPMSTGGCFPGGKTAEA